MKVNGEKMKERYAKRKRIKVKDFNVGDNVVVKVPPIDRGRCNVSRVPAVVVLKRGQVQAKYKLACRFGTIESFYTASSLISYPAPVNILEEGKTISLREAARLHFILKKDISKRNCKTGCKTSHCPCKKINAKCSSQCHKGLKYKNCDKDGPYDKKNMSLPKWGGSFAFNNVKCVFINTCPVDNWLALFCLLSYENPEVYQNVIRKMWEVAVILLQFWDWH